MHNFIKWDDLDFKKSKGNEKISCPVCQSEKQRKGDTSIQINHSEGFGKCFRCEALTFREDKNKQVKEKDYKLPIQTWKNHTTLSDGLVRYIEQTRKINQHTLNALNITEEKYYQPKINKEVNNIVFNYFEKEILVNKKYRDSQKNFTQSSGTRSIFYNINNAIGQKEVYIVEGEFDVLALYQIGIKNAISVPNGANDNDEYWKNSQEYLKDVKKFIIAVDNDTKGNELKERIAQRLGRYRCEYIEWKNKDANDDLKEGVLNDTVKKRIRFPVSGTFTISDLKSDILGLYDNGLPSTIYPKCYRFKKLKDIFSIMLGQLTTVTGVPSHGKSNFVDDYVLNLINDYNFKGSWFSPEHNPMSLYQTNLMEKVIGRSFWKDKQAKNGETISRITKKDIDKYEQWANEKIYLTGAEGNVLPTWDWLLEKFKEQMYSFGINIFVIDAFNKVLLDKGNKIDGINRVLTKLTHFAQSNNVAIILVAHPTKMREDEKTGLLKVPTLYDVSGSADFRNQTHNGFTIYRYFESENEEGYTEFYNMKTKQNFQGVIGGKMQYSYSLVNGRFYERGTQEPFFSLIDYDSEKGVEHFKEETQQILINPEDAFDISGEDIPF
jgi:twinkle protein